MENKKNKQKRNWGDLVVWVGSPIVIILGIIALCNPLKFMLWELALLPISLIVAIILCKKVLSKVA